MDLKKRNNLILITAAVAIFLLTMIDSISIKKFTRSEMMMDTLVEISVFGMGKDKKKLENAIDSAFTEIDRIEKLMSRFIVTSEIAEINASDSDEIYISSETAYILQNSQVISDLTGGAFDVTLAELMELWGFTGDSPSVPDKSAIERLMKHTGNEKYSVSGIDTIYRVKLEDPEVKIDLGGIAKGYAIKRAAEVLKESGVKSAMVDAGGDIVVIGNKKGKPFNVGIKSPDGEGIIGVIGAEDIAIVTSGDYERFFIEGGVKYHHIIDPATGYPARKCKSVTIIADDALVADALSTAVFVMGAEAGIQLVDGLDEVEAMIIDSDDEAHFSQNAHKYIKLKEKE